MGYPRIEEGVGVIDGVNVTFYTPTAPYGIGSVRYYLNGQLQTEDNVVEVDPASGEVRVDGNGQVPPRPGDVVQFFYDDESSVSPEDAGRTVCRVRGVLVSTTDFEGRIEDRPIRGEVSSSVQVVSELVPLGLRGRVEDVLEIRGRMRVCA